MGSALRIAVVGGGIGGLTAALALVKEGHEVACFERMANLREVGAGIGVSPNGTRVLERLGLGEKLAAISVELAVHELVRWQDGRVILRQPIEALARPRWHAPYVTVHRAELHEVLLGAIPPAVLHLGKRSIGAVNRGDSAVVRFEDGSEHVSDVVVGADGIRSSIRNGLIGDSMRFGAMHTFRCLVPSDRFRTYAVQRKRQVYFGPGRSAVTYPVSAGRWINVAGVFPATAERDESWVSEGRVDDVLGAFEGWHHELRTFITAAEKVLVLPLYDRAPVARWTHGRITLLGDAAHPMFPYLGQGANMAIEDAAGLAACLRGVTRDGAPDALSRYEKLRVARTALIQGSSGDGSMAHLPDGPEQEARDAFLSSVSGPDEDEDKLYGYDVEKELADQKA